MLYKEVDYKDVKRYNIRAFLAFKKVSIFPEVRYDMACKIKNSF